MSMGWWWLAPPIVFLIFVSVVTVTHDLVHGSIEGSEFTLFACGAVLFESAHAYRVTHHRHHAVFPGPDDPEGDPARMSFWKSVLWGPFFLPKLWIWAWRREPCQRGWLLAEAAWFGVGVAGAVSFPYWVGWYFVQVLVGSWVYPLLTVHLPHHGYGATPLFQTRTLRGRIVPALFLELTYHLEHHLYPRVPSHNLPELARRLEPSFKLYGVEPQRVP